MKNFLQNKWNILLWVVIFIVLIIVFVFLIDVKLWPWYEKLPQEKKFNSESFLDNLKVISWTIFQWPTDELYTQYGNFLYSTDEYLKLETYDFTNKFFKTRFQNLSSRRIPVQIILENNKYQEYGNTFRELQNYFSWNSNVELRSDEQMWTSYVHAKVTLNEDAFRVQTANLTKSSFESNREHFFYSSDSDFHDSLEKLVDADWTWDDLSTLNLHPNLVVCPLNCRDVIKTLLESAEKSIVIQTQYIVDDEIIDILRKKSEQVDMAIIVADTDDNYDLISYFWPWIARALKTHYNHTKMILVDEKYMLLGSMNLSSNSLDNNREIWIILMDTGHIVTFERWFKQDWFDSI